jgi:hypothetical protein
MKRLTLLAVLVCSCSDKPRDASGHRAAEGVERVGSDVASGENPHEHGPEMIKIAPGKPGRSWPS